MGTETSPFKLESHFLRSLLLVNKCLLFYSFRDLVKVHRGIGHPCFGLIDLLTFTAAERIDIDTEVVANPLRVIK